MWRLGENFGAAVHSLRIQWQRALLTMTGIMVGCSAIVLLVSIATGVQADVRGQVEGLGVNVLVVIPGRIDFGTFNPNLGGMSYLRPEDTQGLESVEGVVDAIPFTFVGGGIQAGKKRANPLLVATEPSWFKMRTTTFIEGGPYTPDNSTQDVCVIGSIAKKELFGEQAALGKPVKINGRTYRIVGVTQDKKSEQSLFSMGGFENLVYLPYPRIRAITPNLQTDRIMVQVAPDTEPKALIKSLEAKLGERLSESQYQVLTQEEILGLVYKLMSILTWLLTGLTSIALFVAGVGIMTVMLMSVNERTKEIGIRKTTGATRRDIFLQFLYEAILLAAVGGIVGLAFSAAVCELLRTHTPVKPMITTEIVTLAIAVCAGVGGIFGLFPAVTASRMDPVAAIRAE
ncbi:MAG: ABC transporter permease [Fimbriimonadaceae bacterium]|nr:ABC transporter permease [Fimbriimonadaceae bacterium]